MGWFLLIFLASLIIWGLGRMSSRISDRWFLSFPLSIFVIVAVMFVSLEVVWEKGRTTTVDGKYIRTVRQLDAFNDGEDFENIEDQPVEEVVEVAAPDEDVLVAGPQDAAEAVAAAATAAAAAGEEVAVVEAPVAEVAPVTVALSGDALAEAEKLFREDAPGVMLSWL